MFLSLSNATHIFCSFKRVEFSKRLCFFAIYSRLSIISTDVNFRVRIKYIFVYPYRTRIDIKHKMKLKEAEVDDGQMVIPFGRALLNNPLNFFNGLLFVNRFYYCGLPQR